MLLPSPGAEPNAAPAVRRGWRLSSPWAWGLLLSLPIAALGFWGIERWFRGQSPIAVGILHSRTGPTSDREKLLIEAELLAIEEINRSGGLLGRSVKGVIGDGGTDGPSFARQAERLIRDERVEAIVGCWSPASRKAVVPVVEAADHLLIHPNRHEGLEQSQHVVSLGPLPNQLAAPAVQWCHATLSARRFFVVGSDEAWARAAGAIVADQLAAIGAKLAGERFIPAASVEVSAAVREITAARPDVVLALLDGPPAAALVRRLREAGLRSGDTPVMMFGVTEDDLRAMPRDDVTGSYVVASHFQEDGRTTEKEFVRSFKSRYGSDRTPSEEAFSAYHAVLLWAGAVRAAGSSDVADVRSAIRFQSLATPEGVIAIDPQNLHAWRGFAVGRIRPDGLIELVWSSRGPSRPAPFPATRSRADWARFSATIQREQSSRRTPAPAVSPQGTPP